MELTLRSEETKHHVVVTVEDGIVIKSAHNKDMKIAELVFTYVVEGDQWVVKAVTVNGFRLKTDETVGRKADDLLYGWPGRFPAWAAKAAEHYRPKAAAPLPAVPTCVLDVAG